MVAASRKYAAQPERIARFVGELTATPEEQDYAVRHLQEAGPYAIPFLIDALAAPGLSASDRALILRNMGRLDRSVVPALAAVLDSSDPRLAADAATVLGLIGDKSAIPFLTFPAAAADSPPVVRAAAQAAISRLTGQSFAAQPQAPIQVLIDSAWRFHRHQVEFLEVPVTVWAWDDARKAPAPRQVARSEAEAILGLRFAKQAMRLDPANREAQVVHMSLTLEKAIERAGFDSFPTKDPDTFAAAKASGVAVLSDVLNTAIADGKSDLAAVTATALAQITDRAALAATGRPHPLVNALYAPGRRVQFAAARALVDLAPTNPFPGSSRIVPVLARFVNNQALPRAVVIDRNPTRGSQLAGFLIQLGYDSELELTGIKGFLAATEAADVELILISYDLFGGGWSLNDTLTNLRADSRTAAIPIFIYGPLNVQYMRPSLSEDYPGIKFLVQPNEPTTLLRQLRGLPVPLAAGERARYAREASALLAAIASRKANPLSQDLPGAEPSMAVAMSDADTAPSVATALGYVPDLDAQRSLCDVALDPSQLTPLRKQSAADLVRSIRRFGPLVTSDQEAKLLVNVREEPDLEIRTMLTTIVAALRAAGPKNAPPFRDRPTRTPAFELLAPPRPPRAVNQ